MGLGRAVVVGGEGWDHHWPLAAAELNTGTTLCQVSGEHSVFKLP